jgi:glycerate-2-kinase
MQGVMNIALLAGSTDGTDGPTNAAGALVTGQTITKANIVDAQKALHENNSYPFLKEFGALLFTGPTDSNVCDIVILVQNEHIPRL